MAQRQTPRLRSRLRPRPVPVLAVGCENILNTRVLQRVVAKVILFWVETPRRL